MKNEPAFPTDHKEMIHGRWERKITGGLTKREYFAAKAMQGLMKEPRFLATDFPGGEASSEWCKHRAAVAVEMADALIAELEKSDAG